MSPTLEETYDAAVTAAVPGLAACLALLFVAFVPLHLLMLDGSSRVVLVATAAGAAVLLGGFALAVRRHRLPDQLAHAVTSGMVLLAVCASVLHLVMVDQPRQTTNVMLLIVGAGAVLLSLRWLAATLYLAWGTWGVGAFLVGATPQWPHFIVGMCIATLLSLVVNHLRRANVRELASARTEAESAAVRDHLTGLANRRGLAMVGGQMVEQARRQGDAVHCIFVDIDGLKRVNDAMGHAIGDEVIVAVAEALRAATRATDVVARWGGDEFCVVGPGAGMAPLELERRVRDGVVLTDEVPAEVWPVRVSAGGAMLAPWDSGTLETLLGKADQEMYLRRSLRKEAGALPQRRAVVDHPPTAGSPPPVAE
ncbi:MAG: GGDEF domain-containing protein [Sporichthyaceae bacterium]